MLKIKKYIDHLLVIFPFEVEIYKQYGVEANYVGNPIFDQLSRNIFNCSFEKSLNDFCVTMKSVSLL